MTKLAKMALQTRRQDDALVVGGPLNEAKLKSAMAHWKKKVNTLTAEVRHLRALHLRDLEVHEGLTADAMTDESKPFLYTEQLTALINNINEKVHISIRLRSAAPLPSDAADKTRCGWSVSHAQARPEPAALHAGGNRCDRCWRQVVHRGCSHSSGSESA